MQVQSNVPVSREADVSNLVLSGPATISWLFEPSGPCSSDLGAQDFYQGIAKLCRVTKEKRKNFFYETVVWLQRSCFCDMQAL